MSSKYSPPRKLKCTDCSQFSVIVTFKKTYETNLCVDCFIEREIKKLKNNKKE